MINLLFRDHGGSVLGFFTSKQVKIGVGDMYMILLGSFFFLLNV